MGLVCKHIWFCMFISRRGKNNGSKNSWLDCTGVICLQLSLCHQAHSHLHLLWPGINNYCIDSPSISPSPLFSSFKFPPYSENNSSLSKTVLFFTVKYCLPFIINLFVAVCYLLHIKLMVQHVNLMLLHWKPLFVNSYLVIRKIF